MFPQTLCDALSNLHSRAPMHSWDFSHALLCQAVGGPLDTYFESIDTTAFASGSIAQVPSAACPRLPPRRRSREQVADGVGRACPHAALGLRSRGRGHSCLT